MVEIKMRKSEMTAPQIATRNEFIQRLIAAEWSPAGWELLFARDHELTPEALAEYQAAHFDMRLSYYVRPGYILLELVRRHDNFFLGMRLYPKEKLSVILDKILAMKNQLSLENYADFIKSIIPLCDPLLIEIPEGLVQASV